MREIKFRAWDEIKNEMFIVNTLDIQSKNHTPCGSFSHDTGVLGECKMLARDSIFMQYTGLKDKNGKEIFGGDILSIKENGINYSVDFIDGGFGLYAYGYFQSITVGKFMEIIGNIYENPELLK